jgi:nuclear pore complex protein Nup160
MGPIFFVTTDGNNSRSGSGRLGTGDLTLAELLIPSFLELAKVDPSPTQEAVPNPERLLLYASQYISWLLLGEDVDHPLSFSGRAISLSNILLQYGQYGNLEVIWFEVGKHPVDFFGYGDLLVFQKPYCLDLWGLFDGQSFLMAIEHFSSQQTLSEGVRTVDGHWCARLHLLGFCLLACACTGLQNSEKEKRIGEAIRCFFQFVSDSSVVDVTS